FGLGLLLPQVCLGDGAQRGASRDLGCGLCGLLLLEGVDALPDFLPYLAGGGACGRQSKVSSERELRGLPVNPVPDRKPPRARWLNLQKQTNASSVRDLEPLLARLDLRHADRGQSPGWHNSYPVTPPPPAGNGSTCLAAPPPVWQCRLLALA